MKPTVISVSKDKAHHFSKSRVQKILLIAGMGVEGDAHAGETVKHRSRVAIDPSAPNLRQVHLMQTEILDELNEKGYQIESGNLGENITTRGIELLSLSKGTLLKIGNEAVIEITGLRNPCNQIEDFRPGMLKEVLQKDPSGTVVKRAGIMGIVKSGGTINVGDKISEILPISEHIPLEGV